MAGKYQNIRDEFNILNAKEQTESKDSDSNLENLGDYDLLCFLNSWSKPDESSKGGQLNGHFEQTITDLHTRQDKVAKEYSLYLKSNKDEGKELSKAQKKAQKKAIVQLVEANLTLSEIFTNLNLSVANKDGETARTKLVDSFSLTFFGEDLNENAVKEFIKNYQEYCVKFLSNDVYKNQITDVYAAFTNGATLSEHWLTDQDFEDFFEKDQCPPILSWEGGKSVIKEGNNNNDFVIINLGQSHWVCAVKEEGDNQYNVYDSLAPNNNFDKYNNNKIALALEDRLKLQELPELTFNHTDLQQDGYSCGTHVINRYRGYKNNKDINLSIKANKTENQKPNNDESDNNKDEGSVDSDVAVPEDISELTHADVVATILNNKLKSASLDGTKMSVTSYKSLKNLYEQCSDQGQSSNIKAVLDKYAQSDDYKVLSSIDSYQIPSVDSELGMEALIKLLFDSTDKIEYKEIKKSDKTVSGYKATFEIGHKNSKGEYQLKQEVLEGGKSVTTLSSNVAFNDFKDQAFKLFQPLSPSILNKNQSLAELKDLSDNDLNAIMKKMLQQGHVKLKLPDSVSGDNAKSYFKDLLNKGAYIQLLNEDESYIKALDAAKKEVYGNSKNKSVKTIGEKIENYEGQQLFKEIIQNYKFKGDKATTSIGFINDINDFKPMDKAEFKKCLFDLCKKTGRVESYFADRLCQKLNTGSDSDKLKDYLGIDKSWINITPEQLRAMLESSLTSSKSDASEVKGMNIFQIACEMNEVKKDEINENTR